MHWLKRLWHWFVCCDESVYETQHRIHLIEDGRTLYSGPRSDLPPEYADKVARLEAQFKRSEEEMEKFRRSFK